MDGRVDRLGRYGDGPRGWGYVCGRVANVYCCVSNYLRVSPTPRGVSRVLDNPRRRVYASRWRLHLSRSRYRGTYRRLVTRKRSRLSRLFDPCIPTPLITPT